MIATGHTTSYVDAEQLLVDVDFFFYQVAKDMVQPQQKGSLQDGKMVLYESEDEGRISFIGRVRLFDGFRADELAMKTLTVRRSMEEMRELSGWVFI